MLNSKTLQHKAAGSSPSSAPIRHRPSTIVHSTGYGASSALKKTSIHKLIEGGAVLLPGVPVRGDRDLILSVHSLPTHVPDDHCLRPHNCLVGLRGRQQVATTRCQQRSLSSLGIELRSSVDMRCVLKRGPLGSPPPPPITNSLVVK